MSTLEIKDLHVHVETKEGIKPILKGATLTVHSGETHAIMRKAALWQSWDTTVPASPLSPTRWPATPSTWSTPARPSSTARTSSR